MSSNIKGSIIGFIGMILAPESSKGVSSITFSVTLGAPGYLFSVVKIYSKRCFKEFKTL